MVARSPFRSLEVEQDSILKNPTGSSWHPHSGRVLWSHVQFVKLGTIHTGLGGNHLNIHNRTWSCSTPVPGAGKCQTQMPTHTVTVLCH